MAKPNRTCGRCKKRKKQQWGSGAWSAYCKECTKSLARVKAEKAKRVVVEPASEPVLTTKLRVVTNSLTDEVVKTVEAGARKRLGL